MQTVPAQQAFEAEHAWPRRRQAVPQVPPAQVSEQHSAVLAQAPPVAVHAARRQVPAAQRPEQQSPWVEQVAPSAAHTTGATQRPALQVVPEQQSAWAAQARPAAWQAQRPPMQNICPQHS